MGRDSDLASRGPSFANPPAAMLPAPPPPRVELVPGIELRVAPGSCSACPCAIAAETAATGGCVSSSTSIASSSSSSAPSPSESV